MRRNLRIFAFLFIFFIVIAIGSLMVLNGHGSVFNRSRDSLGAQTAVLTQTVIGEEKPEEPEEEVEVSEPEPEPEPVVVEPEPVAEPEPEPVAEVAEAEPIAEAEPVEEDEPEEAAEPVDDSGVKYYTYTINTSVHSLRLRQEPNINSRIIAYMKKKTSGYILKMDDNWTKVHTQDGIEGYCSTEYLVITEVSRDDFPEELRDKVESAD